MVSLSLSLSLSLIHVPAKEVWKNKDQNSDIFGDESRRVPSIRVRTYVVCLSVCLSVRWVQLCNPVMSRNGPGHSFTFSAPKSKMERKMMLPNWLITFQATLKLSKRLAQVQ